MAHGGKWKCTAAVLLSLLLLGGCTGMLADSTESRSSSATGTPAESLEATVSIPEQTSQNEAYSMYTLEAFTQKFWQGNTVYHDSICFVEQPDGSIASGSLLYVPAEVVSVRSGDLKTEYQEGRDFTIQGNRLVLTPDSSIPVFPYDKYCTGYTGEAGTDWLRITGTDKVLLATPALLEYVIMVSYTHSDSWDGLMPESQLPHLPRTEEKLGNKRPINIVFFGDSITAGWDASGQDEKVIDVASLKETYAKTARAPFTPAWAEMVTQQLRNRCAYLDIHKINRAASGATSYWGKANVQTLVNPQNPDLVIIAFGMNEALTPADEFKANILSILDTIHAENPQTEFLLVSCMMPNRDSVSFAKNTLKAQEDALYAIQTERMDLSIGVVPVHSMFLSLHERGKRYTDYSSNNINHPNDFAVRLYAQMVLQALGQ